MMCCIWLLASSSSSAQNDIHSSVRYTVEGAVDIRRKMVLPRTLNRYLRQPHLALLVRSLVRLPFVFVSLMSESAKNKPVSTRPHLAQITGISPLQLCITDVKITLPTTAAMACAVLGRFGQQYAHANAGNFAT